MIQQKELLEIELDFIIELVINYNKRHKEFKRISGQELVQRLVNLRYHK